LKVERGYTGGYTMVKDAVQKWKVTTKEMFVPLSHPPAKIIGSHERQVTKEFQRLQSHYLFETREQQCRGDLERTLRGKDGTNAVRLSEERLPS
jgi:hypothetical protein